MGKSGLVGAKIAATLTSTGTPAHFLHPTEARHGEPDHPAPKSEEPPNEQEEHEHHGDVDQEPPLAPLVEKGPGAF